MMKKFGEGWQYTAYDLGNGRVRKIHSSKIEQFLFIHHEAKNKHQPHSFIDVISEIRVVNRREIEANTYVKKIISRIGADTFGNPVFLNSRDYEQDKAVTLGDALEHMPLEEAKRLLDGYPRLIHRMWQY